MYKRTNKAIFILPLSKVYDSKEWRRIKAIPICWD